MSDDEKTLVAEMTQTAARTSLEIQGQLHGLGGGTQGAILADLVSMWIAAHFERSELGNAPNNRPLTAEVRAKLFLEWTELVLMLVPESEKQILQNVEPEGRA